MKYLMTMITALLFSLGLATQATAAICANVGVAAPCVNIVDISNGSVTQGKLANNAVTTGKLGNAAVTQGKLANLAVTTGKLGNAAVTQGKLANGAVTTGKLGNAAVTQGKLANLAVSTGKIANSAVTASKLGANAKPAGAAFKVGSLGILTTVNQLVNSVTITAPSAGYVFVSHQGQASCGLAGNLYHHVKNATTGDISSITGWDMTTKTALWVFAGVSKIFPVAAGTNVIEVWARCNAVAAPSGFKNDDLSVVFIPATY